jgi:peroxiredoxin
MYTAFNQSRVDSLSVQYAASRSKADFTSIKSKLDNAYLEIFNDQKSWVSNFINKHLQSLASVFVINQRFGPNILLSETSEPELFVRLDSALHTKFTDNPLVTDFHERTKLLKSLINSRKAAAMCISAGIKAPEIVLHDASGKMQKLSSTKGKLTLVYFWAAWNAMSRKSNLELLLLYNELNNKGFEIFAISLDSDFEMWEKAWRLDKAFWRQLHDPDGFNSVYCRLYGVQSLPTFILIGRDGRVISATNSLNDIKTLINNNI